MSQTNETGWVIEAAGPKYWSGRGIGTESFSESHADAVRFARDVDASVVLSWCFSVESQRLLVVRQHMWGLE